MVRHARIEGAELLDADAALALVHVVDHIVREVGNHALAVAGVERLVVGADQLGGLDAGLAFGVAHVFGSGQRIWPPH